MSDLIDRQAAIDALRYAQHRFTVADEAGGMGIVKWSEDVIYFAAAEKVLDEMPTIEAEPVRHGKWIEHKDYPGLAYLCSECGRFTTERSHYCPDCGAKMDGERRTDETD